VHRFNVGCPVVVVATFQSEGTSVALDFKSILSRKSQPLLGLDISSGSVKLVELSASGKNFRLERYAIEPLPKGVMIDGNIDNMDSASEVVSRAVKKLGSRNRNVALAMPSAQVITKRIFLPAGLTEDEYETQVESEASQYIPFALDEVSLDFQVLGPSSTTPDDVEVLIAASRWDKVEDRFALAESAGLKAMVMDVDSYAVRAVIERLGQQMPNQAQDKLIAVFNIGANMTNLSVFQNGQNVYVREQPFGGAQLTQDIARAYGMTFEEADARKRSGDLPENYQRDLLQPFVESAISEIVRGLQFFFTSTPYGKVDKILLGGGSAVLEGLVDAAASRTQVETSIVNPFKGMGLGASVREKQLLIDAPGLLTCAGLAMRRFEA
jgi:type IV pilus assembly protein PilM